MVDYDDGPDNVVYETQCGNSRFSVKSIFWKMSSDKKNGNFGCVTLILQQISFY